MITIVLTALISAVVAIVIYNLVVTHITKNTIKRQRETASNGGAFGLFDTILDTDISPCPFDNIMVSKGILIENAGRVADPWMTDHAIIWADLLIP